MIHCVIRHYMFGALGYYGVIGYGKYVEISIGEFGVFRYTNKGAIRCDT